MITDDLLRVSENQVLTGVTDSSVVSDDKIDLSVARDIGEGEELYMVFTIGTAVTVGTSTKFEAIVASDAALTTAIETIGDTGAIATASLTINSQFAVKLNPSLFSKGKRYLGARYTVVGTNSTGKVTTDIVKNIADGKKFYASGFTVL